MMVTCYRSWVSAVACRLACMDEKKRKVISAIGLAFVAVAMTTLFIDVFTVSAHADTLSDVGATVVGLVSKAATYVGAVIVLWGIFQLILAFRRGDSEALGSQITTIVVGAMLIGLGVAANSIFSSLTGDSGGNDLINSGSGSSGVQD